MGTRKKTLAAAALLWLLSFSGAPVVSVGPDASSAAAVMATVSERVVRITRFGPAYALSDGTGYRLDLRPELTIYGDCSSQQIQVLMTIPREYRGRTPQGGYPPPGSKFQGVKVVNRFSHPRAPPQADAVCEEPGIGQWIIADDARSYHVAKTALDDIENYLVETSAETAKAPFAIRCEEHGTRCRDPLESLRRAFKRGFERVGVEGGGTEFKNGRPIQSDVIVRASNTPLFEPNCWLTAKLRPDGHVAELEISFTYGAMP